MLGQYVSASVIEPIGSITESGFIYPLNYAKLDDYENEYAFIYGEDRSIGYFDGIVVAALMPREEHPDKKPIWIIADEDERPINIDIMQDIDMDEFPEYHLKCLYETSCGAIVYRFINDQVRYLLIKNRRSKYWGWPKGHMERGETKYDTARREVLEETGLRIDIHLGYEGESHYTLSDNTQKVVYVFIAGTGDERTVIQKEEIANYVWVPYKTAMIMLKFQNDRKILEAAVKFLHREKSLEKFVHQNRLQAKERQEKQERKIAMAKAAGIKAANKKKAQAEKNKNENKPENNIGIKEAKNNKKPAASTPKADSGRRSDEENGEIRDNAPTDLQQDSQTPVYQDLTPFHVALWIERSNAYYERLSAAHGTHNETYEADGAQNGEAVHRAENAAPRDDITNADAHRGEKKERGK